MFGSGNSFISRAGYSADVGQTPLPTGSGGGPSSTALYAQIPARGNGQTIDLPTDREIQAMNTKQLREEADRILGEAKAFNEARPNMSVRDEQLFEEALQVAGKMNTMAKEQGTLNLVGGNGGGRFSVHRDSSGNQVYSVGAGQRLVDVPGFGSPSSETPLADIVVASITGKQAGLTAAISRASDGSHLLEPRQYGQTFDFARDKSVLSAAGMRIIPMDGSELQIARVTADPTFDKKFEGQAFHEDTAMRLGGIRIFPKLFGTIITLTRELIDDASNSLALIEQTLQRALAAKIDQIGLTGIGAAEEMQGLLNYPNIDSTPTVGAIDWVKLASAALKVRQRNHEPTAAILGTAIDHALGMSTDNEDRWLGPPPPLQNVTRLETMSIDGSKAVIGDFSQFAMILRAEPRLEITYEAGDNFKNHTAQVKLWTRADFVCFDEGAFQVLDGVTAGS